MTETNWLIYGATGFTGRLIVEEAVQRGHKPILSGRSAARLKPLADRLGLRYVAIGLHDHLELVRAAKRVNLVLHCAGPFIATAAPMLRACLTGGAHYLDISGEIPIFENALAYDSSARAKHIAMISGCGFDVIPEDCLAAYVAAKIKDPIDLETGVDARGTRVSGGSARTGLNIISRGGQERRDGRLSALPLGQGGKWIALPSEERYMIPVPSAALASAYRHTRIPNITAYMSIGPGRARLLRLFSSLLIYSMTIRPLRGLAQAIAGRLYRGSDQHTRETSRAVIWARALDMRGNSAEAWLDIPEAYQFTAVAAVRCVEKVLAGGVSGALTPAQAFGADFPLEIDTVRRLDSLNS